MTHALLKVEHATFCYPVRRSIADCLLRREAKSPLAIDDVSFNVDEGEFVALVGESGAGKTTIIRAVLGLVSGVDGRVSYKGDDISTLAGRTELALRRSIQVVFQDPYESLDPRFRVRDTVAEPLIVHASDLPRSVREDKVRNALERVGLVPERHLERYPHELSGGERQRVAIAASLVLEPDLLIADEPVSMLDLSVRSSILELLKDLQKNDRLGILMITHDLATAAHTSDRMMVLYRGRIVEDGPTWDIVSEPRHPYTRALLAAVPAKDPRQSKARSR